MDGLKALCLEQVPPGRLKALMALGPGIFGYGSPGEVVLMALVSRLRPKIKYTRLNEAFLLMVDARLFKLDVKKGLFGDLLADKLLTPYLALEGSDYLRELDVAFKQRIITELLSNLVLDLPEFASEIYIDPRYFLYEAVFRMSRIMPLSAYMFANLLARREDRHVNEAKIMEGFKEAISALEAFGYLRSEGGFVRLGEKALKKGMRAFIINDLAYGLGETIRGLRRHLMKILPGLAKAYVLEKEVFLRRSGREAKLNPLSELPRPESFLLLKTHLGLRPAFAKAVLEEIARLLGPVRKQDDIRISEIGGSLNVVYLVSVEGESGRVRFVVKKFKNWNNLKWLSLRLWSFGAKKFVISGRKRLKHEYSMCNLLSELGFPVPRILHVDLTTNTLVEEFIEGFNLAEPMRAFMFGEGGGGSFLALVENAGQLVARIHSHDVTLGDCKPENFIIDREGRVYLVDLEQASVGGDKAWDVAEFLYYSGHFVPSLAAEEVFEPIARAFLRGYLGAGGSPEVIKKASSVKFARVFSIFTPPQVMKAINKACREEAD